MARRRTAGGGSTFFATALNTLPVGVSGSSSGSSNSCRSTRYMPFQRPLPSGAGASSTACMYKPLGAPMDTSAPITGLVLNRVHTTEAPELSAEASVLWQRAETERKKPANDRNEAQMLDDYATAASGFERMDARPFIARTTRDWGHALRSVGRTDLGNAKLRTALTMLDALGITREANEVRAILALAPSGPLLSVST